MFTTQSIDVKNVFMFFFILATFFALFNVLFIFQRFYYKKTLFKNVQPETILSYASF